MTETTSEAANKALVRRYFREALDGRNSAVMAELFEMGALQHFPGRTLTFRGPPPAAEFANRQFRSILHHLIAEGDLVVAHLTHEVTFGPNARYHTRLGPVDVSGRSIRWDAMALFRIVDGKIAEEWVNRDELDILAQLGVIQVETTS